MLHACGLHISVCSLLVRLSDRRKADAHFSFVVIGVTLEIPNSN